MSSTLSIIAKRFQTVQSSHSIFKKTDPDRIEVLAQRFASHYARPTADKISAFIDQFGSEQNQRIALTLLENVEYIDDCRMRELFSEFERGLAWPTRQKAIFCVLGGPQDSSNPLTFEIGKAFPDGPARKPVFSLTDVIRLYRFDEVVVFFVDDFVGSGGNAIHRFKEWLGLSPPNHVAPLSAAEIEWLRAADLRYFAFVACLEGVSRLQSFLHFKGISLRVKPAIVTQDSEGCFKATSRIFPISGERTQARELARTIGYELLAATGKFDDETSHAFAVGYRASQKLVVFQRNTPSSTLPILWLRGKCQGNLWEPLFPRR